MAVLAPLDEQLAAVQHESRGAVDEVAAGGGHQRGAGPRAAGLGQPGPAFPDPQADRGQHELTVTIRPGARIADAVEEGYRTNLVPRLVRGASPVEPLFALSNPALVVEAVKLAEDGSGDVVVRLYESLGRRSIGTITANFPVQGSWAVDLLERPVQEPGVECGGNLVELKLRPFQLVTLRFAR